MRLKKKKKTKTKVKKKVTKKVTKKTKFKKIKEDSSQELIIKTKSQWIKNSLATKTKYQDK